MPDKVTALGIRAMKGHERIVCLTAYDAAFGAMADEAGVDLILVGDSVGNVMLGYPNTVPVTLDEMVHHTRAVRAGVRRALLVADMPFGSYQSSVAQAVDSAVALMKAGAEAVKLEGDYVEAIEAIIRAGIPVMGHVGMTPQSYHAFGGHRVQGRGEGGSEVIRVAQAVAEAGAFSLVIELVPMSLAGEITRNVPVPTVGIGAGPLCDGQIQVLHDVLGLATGNYRHAKRYLEGRELVIDAFGRYAQEVRQAAFPKEENGFQ